jgi:starvation-inducible DNA-binding protein
MATNPSAPRARLDRFTAARIVMAGKANEATIASLNRVLADSMMLRDIYKKSQWEVTGEAFYKLRALYAVHHDEQGDLIELIAERIQSLGGRCIAMPAEVIQYTTLATPPRTPELPQAQLRRLLDAHKRMLYALQAAAKRALDIGDDATHDVLTQEVIPVHTRQCMLVQLEVRQGSSEPDGDPQAGA